MKIIKRIAYSLIIIGLYFTLWRPARAYLMENTIVPIVTYAVGNGDNGLKFEKYNSVSIKLVQNHVSDQGNGMYLLKFPLGLFFLMGCVALAVAGSDIKYYGWLLLVHLCCGLLSLFFVFLAAEGLTVMLNGSRFIFKIILPIASIAMLLFAMQDT